MTRIVHKALMTAVAVVMSASMAFAALSLDAAKSQGLVGEQPDGLVGIVTAAPTSELAALVGDINAERLKKYQDIAARNGTQVGQVQAVAGQKLINSTPAGQYIKNASGSWQTK
jgi:uncharacterized protein